MWTGAKKETFFSSPSNPRRHNRVEGVEGWPVTVRLSIIIKDHLFTLAPCYLKGSTRNRVFTMRPKMGWVPSLFIFPSSLSSYIMYSWRASHAALPQNRWRQRRQSWWRTTNCVRTKAGERRSPSLVMLGGEGWASRILYGSPVPPTWRMTSILTREWSRRMN